MVYFLNDEETFVEAASKSSASYVMVTIYGKKVAIAWPDEEAPRLSRGGSCLSIRRPYALSSRDFKAEDTVVRVGDVEIGPRGLTVAAGPCSVEDEEELVELGASLKRMGADMLRGGAFKPRTSPYSFLGMGENALRALQRVRDELGLPVVSEVLDAGSLPLYKNVDMLQVGTRNAQNFPLLQALGDFNKPVLLKRGMSNTVEEWLAASEYVLSRGNGNVVLCERGIRAPGSSTRFSLDVGGIPKVRRLSHLPICADPSHSAGERDLVEPLTLAAVAAGAQMLLIEVHPHPESALSDGDQQITPDAFGSLLSKARALWQLVTRVEVRERDELESRVRNPVRKDEGGGGRGDASLPFILGGKEGVDRAGRAQGRGAGPIAGAPSVALPSSRRRESKEREGSHVDAEVAFKRGLHQAGLDHSLWRRDGKRCCRLRISDLHEGHKACGGANNASGCR